MINSKLKRLIKCSADIIALYQEHTEDYTTFEVIPFMDITEEESEVVTINLVNVTNLEWKFLEPLSNYCIDKKINWTIRLEGCEQYLAIDIS